MWTIRDSDGAETLHSIYPGWAENLDHLTVTMYVPKAQLEAVTKELDEARKLLKDAKVIANRHMWVMKQNGVRLREVEDASNRYYGILQRYNLINALPDNLDDTPIIDVMV